ncbi:MAG: AbrB/MazE/SpoVT family DNA-binding domain-containing protein [Acidimicrobiaceae bacterium]|nr:AbrB/MazE/SpoVT family DNA-binding domain-containing protein [Acidimicrobiaceae bacterium]
MGDRGRVVIPADVRSRGGLEPGTQLMLFETGDGLLLSTPAQLLERIRREFADSDVTSELLTERRLEAEREDAEMVHWLAQDDSAAEGEDAA